MLIITQFTLTSSEEHFFHFSAISTAPSKATIDSFTEHNTILYNNSNYTLLSLTIILFNLNCHPFSQSHCFTMALYTHY